jgi:glucosylceramidase
VEGVGAALTHSSAYVFHHNLTAERRDSLFRVLFTPEGIGINYTRLCIGASDFAFNLSATAKQKIFR